MTKDIFYKNSFFIPQNPFKPHSRAWGAWEVWLKSVNHGLIPYDIYEAPDASFNSYERPCGADRKQKQDKYIPKVYKRVKARDREIIY